MFGITWGVDKEFDCLDFNGKEAKGFALERLNGVGICHLKIHIAGLVLYGVVVVGAVLFISSVVTLFCLEDPLLVATRV